MMSIFIFKIRNGIKYVLGSVSKPFAYLNPNLNKLPCCIDSAIVLLPAQWAVDWTLTKLRPKDQTFLSHITASQNKA